ncbi:MAG: hypothetical protein ISQ14_01720 [Verrucomicrobiae bacterium]|jgi:predicted Abi (CAAX) family protease|nr:hypothetical protein [Verrucomicrobiae bacterium]
MPEDPIDFNAPQYKRPEDQGDPYVIKKDGKDPWRTPPAVAAASWIFWLAMLYFVTAGFIYGALTGKEEKITTTARIAFAPAEFLRDWSMTYREITDWQIGFFRKNQDNPSGMGR